MPKWSWLFEALLESVPYLIYLLGVIHCLFKSVPVVVCFVTSCHKYQGILPLLWYLVCHKDHLHLPLEEFPCGNLVGCSPVHLQILLPWDRWHFVCKYMVLSGPPERNWMRAISVMVKGIDLTFGMYWGVLRQHPLVMAYRGRTNRNWIIEVTVLSWKDQVIAYG